MFSEKKNIFHAEKTTNCFWNRFFFIIFILFQNIYILF